MSIEAIQFPLDSKLIENRILESHIIPTKHKDSQDCLTTNENTVIQVKTPGHRNGRWGEEGGGANEIVIKKVASKDGTTWNYIASYVPLIIHKLLPITFYYECLKLWS